jgi:hypothetical protein
MVKKGLVKKSISALLKLGLVNTVSYSMARNWNGKKSKFQHSGKMPGQKNKFLYGWKGAW